MCFLELRISVYMLLITKHVILLNLKLANVFTYNYSKCKIRVLLLFKIRLFFSKYLFKKLATLLVIQVFIYIDIFLIMYTCGRRG